MADLHAIGHDLSDARWHAKLLLDVYEARDERFLFFEPLAISALTKYFRVFGSGRRFKLNADADAGLSTELMHAHFWLRAIRDKHFQHPVNRRESDYVTLQVAAHGSPQAEVVAVSGGAHATVGLSTGEAEALIELCNYWIDRVRALQAEEAAILLEDARGLTVDELNSLDMASPEFVDDPFQLRAAAS